MTRTKKPGQPATRILQRDRLLQSSGLVQDAPTKKTPPRNNGKHPGGRPSNYDPDYHPAKVLEGMQQGMSLNEAALNAGISAVAQWKWQQDDTKPEFQKAVKEGLRAAEVWWERHARENIGNSKFNAVLWMMNMSNRFGWKRKDDVSVNANSTVTHEIPNSGSDWRTPRTPGNWYR